MRLKNILFSFFPNKMKILITGYDQLVAKGIKLHLNTHSDENTYKFINSKECKELQHMRFGNIKAIGYWEYAKDYVYAMWLMLQHEHIRTWLQPSIC